ncbi:hypothetical protein OV203_34425 [Nannocystis sp. ILAH1]|uniref:hypothetical protein n=1 Tax=unclassified Nannocystis TaxID=2627009 RepID=UPI0022712B40|nr:MULTISPECIES: hypothetical protein [unclassified Nannocystis]MCY0992285.1 hypothetical protein [Nannocystis sp. ILAH1]MCY1069127.1 hypothetical protein [Nannocystis sp. RBIL2]
MTSVDPCGILDATMQQAWSSAVAPVSVFILGTAAIPRGHEIEFVIYVKPARGFLSVEAKYTVLTDRVTGVVYTPWVNEGETPPWHAEDVEIEARVQGRVLQCHVQTMTHADGTAGTRLLVDVSSGPADR